MPSKKQQVNKTDIRKALSESAFNPKENGPLRIVAEVGNVDYYTTRAIELVREAQDEPTGSNDFFKAKIEQAISLLALAKAHVQKIR